MRHLKTVFLTAIFMSLPMISTTAQKIEYPKTKKVEQTDDYHGTKVADPYRWLEDDNSAETKAWVEAQNKVTFAYLNRIPEREQIKKRLTELWNYEKYSAPFKRGNRYFYYKNDGLQNQSVLYVADSVTDKGRVLLDPNRLSAEGTVALSGLAISDDGKLMAYGLAGAGSDWQEWRFMDVETGKDLPDVLKNIKFSGASWTLDGKGVYYSRYPEADPKAKLSAENFNQKLYFHRLGTPQAEDVLVYERPDDKEMFVGGFVSEDGKWLIINVGKGTSPMNMVFYKDLTEADSPVLPLVDKLEADYSFIGNDGATFYFRTDKDAPRGRVVAVQVKESGFGGSPPRGEYIYNKRRWREIIPQSAETLEGADFINNQFVGSYLKDAYTQFRVYDIGGKFVRSVDLPGIGTAGGFGGKRFDTETFYTYSSFNTPPTIYRYDMKSGKSELFRKSDVKFNPADYEVKQVRYKSKDGTEIPMFVVHKKGLKMDGNNPTLLYAYGGFNVSMTPGFSVSRLVWLENGGVFAMPNLRGGGEYGEEWHEAGTKLKKQNVFDDFIGAAEWLIAGKYTQPSKLAISGGSNGGLLVGAVLNQRPDLFAAALPAVGVMDMLRFHRFTIGRAWISDYGSADNAEEFRALYAYSPLHNIKKGAKYPAVLVTTADHDDRVVPAHSFKYAATLQEMQGGDAPVLIRIETKAGHGAGKPTAKIIEEQADIYGFLMKNLGMSR
ncbi:MAG TPA: prolyl oligopeptidase family serine peptidase [Pyrinomonadaceae bacterium]|nr:prolyl oligopeptidase family serine peptidase [Pyrinomonadaceae bacterium]